MESNLHYGEGNASSSTIIRSGSHQRISWAAVIAGVIIAVFIQLTLTLLGLAIGLSTVDATNHNTPGTGLAIGSGIWYVLTMLISLFFGGWVAGRLAKDKHTSESVIHGLLVSGLMFILTFYFLTSALGSILGGAGSLISGAGSTVGKAMATEVPAINDAVKTTYDTTTKAQVKADSQKVVGAINQNKGAVEQKAREVADDAASASSKGAWYSFFGIVLGAAASAFGAKKGRDSKEPADYHTHRTAQV
ncbi:MAG: hypothetical protein V5804_15185 [Mucilaginibacter sp.]|uniref:hypothetical protein n=1 Tax=Mucilaginibacter sp. TaxID=1882438 RepID=UPI0034E45F5C